MKLHFAQNDSQVCYKYNVTNDDICEIQRNEVIFKVRLSLVNTENIRLQSNLSLATVIIDDSAEEECCK